MLIESNFPPLCSTTDFWIIHLAPPLPIKSISLFNLKTQKFEVIWGERKNLISKTDCEFREKECKKTALKMKDAIRKLKERGFYKKETQLGGLTFHDETLQYFKL